MNNFKFVDLFSGIGAFHIAMEELGGECVFSSEIDKNSIKTYKDNFNISSNHNMFEINPEDIPKHDVLCAGFPCQPFSNAGNKKGFTDTRGTLFFEIERILKIHKTKFIILENVKHLVKHDDGKTYKTIIEHLKDLGYILMDTPLIISPHELGIPQNRDRIFIVGIHKSYTNQTRLMISKPQKDKYPQKSVYTILDNQVDKKYNISPYEEKILEAWNDFRVHFSQNIISPVLVDEFDETYDYSGLQGWKQNYCKKNRLFYSQNKKYIDNWLKKYDVKNFKLRDRKFEWQAGKDIKSVYDTLIQLRQSGIRCKRSETYPALVAIVQTSIIGKYKRRITPREAARLQSFPETYKLNETDTIAYKQLGNSANVEVIKHVAKQLFNNI